MNECKPLVVGDPDAVARIKARQYARAQEERQRVERRLHAERVVQRARYTEALQDTIKAQLAGPGRSSTSHLNLSHFCRHLKTETICRMPQKCTRHAGKGAQIKPESELR